MSGGNDSCNWALTKARETHQPALEATHILEKKIEWLSQSATRIRSISCQHSHSHGHLRRQSRRCPRGHTKTPTGEDQARTPLATSHQENQRGRCFPSPSWEDGSPSRTSKVNHCLRNTLWGSIQGRHLLEVNQQSVTWGPCLLWSPSWSLSWGAITHVRHGRGSWPATRALCGKLWGVGGVASPPCWHAGVMGGISCHPQCGGL